MSTLSNSDFNPDSDSGVQVFEYREIPLLVGAKTEDARGEPAQASGTDCNYDGRLHLTEDELNQQLLQARLQGVQEGESRTRAEYEKQLQEERAKLAASIAGFAAERAKYYSKVEAELVNLALAIAAKILHREAQVDRMLVAGLAKVALENIHQATTVIIRVRRENVESWQRYFGKASQTHTVQVMEDDSLAEHDCVLETDLGGTRLGLQNQLKEIEQGFFDLLAQRPEPR